MTTTLTVPRSPKINGYLKAVAENRPNAVAALLGISHYEKITLHDLVERGLPFHSFDDIRQVANASQKLVADIVSISNKTLMRRKFAKRFDVLESDRIVRLSRIVGKAIELFEGDGPKAQEWLKTPLKALGNKTPLEMCRTDVDAREVEELIGRLEHGIFS